MCDVEKSVRRPGICVIGTRKIFTRIFASGEHGGVASLWPPGKVEQSKNI